LMLRINSPCRHRDLSRVRGQTTGHCLHRGSAAAPPDSCARSASRGPHRLRGASATGDTSGWVLGPIEAGEDGFNTPASLKDTHPNQAIRG
jgi:hypothetical protein